MEESVGGTPLDPDFGPRGAALREVGPGIIGEPGRCGGKPGELFHGEVGDILDGENAGAVEGILEGWAAFGGELFD